MNKKPKISRRHCKLDLDLKGAGRTSYSVGYGRPPLHSRFAPEKSGNPKGRPRGQLNLETELRNELNRLITVREGDRSRQLKKGAAWIVRTVNAALNNDHKANATLIALLRTLIVGQPPQGTAETPVTGNDSDLLADFIRRHANLHADRTGAGLPNSKEPDESD